MDTIGIIGGADGPTQVYVTGSSGGSMIPWIIAGVLLVAAIVLVLVLRHRRK